MEIKLNHVIIIWVVAIAANLFAFKAHALDVDELTIDGVSAQSQITTISETVSVLVNSATQVTGVGEMYAITNTFLTAAFTVEIPDFTILEVTDPTFYTMDLVADEVTFNKAGRYRVNYSVNVVANAGSLRTVVCVWQTASGGPYAGLLKAQTSGAVAFTNIFIIHSTPFSKSFTYTVAAGDTGRMGCSTTISPTSIYMNNPNINIEYLGQ